MIGNKVAAGPGKVNLFEKGAKENNDLMKRKTQCDKKCGSNKVCSNSCNGK